MKKNNLLIKILCCLLSAGLFYLANPNCLVLEGLGFLAWIYYIPLLLTLKNSTNFEALLCGFIYGFASYSLYITWMLKAYPVAYCVLIFFFVFIWAFVSLGIKLCCNVKSKISLILSVFFLTSFEYLKTQGFLGFGYGVSAYTQWKYINLIQICNLIGVFGLNFLIILSNLYLSFLIFKLFSANKITIKDFSPLFFWVTCIFVLEIYGIVFTRNQENSKKLTVALIQGNEDPWKNDFEAYEKTVQTLENLTDRAIIENPNVQLVVWPETSVVPAVMYYYKQENNSKRKNLISDLISYIESKNVSFIIGNGHRTVENKNQVKQYNSALFFDLENSGGIVSPEIYSKNKLVPFTEYFPFSSRFKKLQDLLLKNNFQFWEPGKEIVLFEKNGIKLGTPICFEDNFSGTCRKMTKAGADCFVNLSNDSWAHSKVCQNQHLAMAVFRNVENCRPSVRCTTDGKSCYINQYGKLLAELPSFTEDFFVVDLEVPVLKKSTLYTKTGDLAGILEVFGFFILLIIELINVKIKGIKE